MARLVLFLVFIPAAIIILILLAFLLFPNVWRDEKEGQGGETFALSITTPEDEAYTQTSLVKIIGKTAPGTLIIAYSNDAGEIALAKSDGIFSFDFPLKEGLNEISVLAQNEAGEEKQEARDIFYDREGLILLEKSSPTESEKAGSPSGIQEVKERIRKERERQKIKVHAGFVKAILGQNLTLNTRNGPRTIRLADDAKITIGGKETKLAEIQVEDYAIAVGRVDSSSLAGQILIVYQDARPPISRKGLFGIVSQIGEADITIVDQNKGEETKIILDKSTKILTKDEEKAVNDIKVGARVALVAKIAEVKIFAEKIFLDPKDHSFILAKFGKVATKSATSSAKEATKSAR